MYICCFSKIYFYDSSLEAHHIRTTSQVNLITVVAKRIKPGTYIIEYNRINIIIEQNRIE